jgi:hypothetical protein
MIVATKWMYANPQENWDLGKEIGLSEEAIEDYFRFCCYELKLELVVEKDGMAFCTHVNGIPLTQKVRV